MTCSFRGPINTDRTLKPVGIHVDPVKSRFVWCDLDTALTAVIDRSRADIARVIGKRRPLSNSERCRALIERNVIVDDQLGIAANPRPAELLHVT